MEFILIKYRSILYYCVELIKAYFPKTEGYKLEGKYQLLNEVLKNESQFNKYILSSKWYQYIKDIRDTIIHQGATCVVYSGKDLGFQVYDLSVDDLYSDADYMKVNKNLYKVDMFLLVHIA